MTYGYGVDREQAWPRQLGRLSALPIYNMAFVAWGPTEHLLLFEQAAAMRPALVIETVYTGNDLLDAYGLVYDAGQLPQLRTLEPSVLRALARADRDPSRIRKVYQQPPEDLQLRREWSMAMPGPFGRDSKLAGLLKAASVVSARARTTWEFEEPGRELGKNDWRFAAGGLETVFNPPSKSQVLDLGDPRIDEGLRISLEALRQMDERAAAEGIGFSVLLVPTKELVFRDAVYQHAPAVPGAYRELIENEERVWQRMEAFLTGHRIAYIDALPALRRALASGPQPYPRSRDSHPNEIGYRVLAELAHREVNRRGLLRK